MRVIRMMLMLVGLMALPAVAQPLVRLATLAPKGTVFETELQAMGQKWQAAGGPRLAIYTDGSLGSEEEMVRRMRHGQIHAAMLTVSGLSEIDKSVAALQNMPMMFRSAEELDYVREKLRGQFEQKFRAKGFEILFWGDAGWVRFFSRTPATTPQQFQQMKLFTGAGSPDTTALWRASGFQPVELEITGILLGLSTGRIDVVPTEPSYALAAQFYTQTPHMLDLKWAPLVGATVMDARSFNAQKPAVQQAMRAAAAETGRRMTAAGRANSEKAIEVMQKQFGLTVYPVTPQNEAAWRTMSEAAWPKIRGSIVPAETFDEVVKHLTDYRQSGSQGQQ